MGGKILDYEAKDILNRGKAEGRAEGRAETVLDFLREIGSIPEELQERILGERDLEVLVKWVKLAAKSDSIDEFIGGM